MKSCAVLKTKWGDRLSGFGIKVLFTSIEPSYIHYNRGIGSRMHLTKRDFNNHRGVLAFLLVPSPLPQSVRQAEAEVNLHLAGVDNIPVGIPFNNPWQESPKSKVVESSSTITSEYDIQ